MKNTRRNRRVLGGVVGVNMALALAVSAGAVPRPGADGPVHAATIAQAEEAAAPAAARQPGDNATPAVAEATPTPTTAAPAPPPQPTTTVAKPKVTTPTTKAPARIPATTAPVAAAAPATTVPVTVAKVARRTPTAAEIQGVISEMKSRIPLLNFVSVSAAQVNDIGNQVCTAFDNGQTFAQVKVTGLSMIPSTVSVPAGTDDWAVRKAVALYCPGHANKLV